MILEIDTSILDIIPDLTINQLVLLNLVMNDNQSNNQYIHKLISLVSESEVQDLINRDFIAITLENNNTVLHSTDKLISLLKEDKTMFDQFYDNFPVCVIRPDGTKGFLRANISKCRKEYNKIIGKSRAMHEHLLKCLNFEVQNKMMTGKLGYMKTMWKWITQREWEAIEDQMNETPSYNTYGTELI